jgi:hypothetical protein
MTEAEWLASADPRPMLESLCGKVSVRKFRLFVCACCRRLWGQLDDERSRAVIQAAEGYADGVVSGKRMQAATRAAGQAAWRRGGAVHAVYQATGDSRLLYGPPSTGVAGREWTVWAGRVAWWLAAIRGGAKEGLAQVALLRCVFGSPFRPLTLGLASLPPAVTLLAQAAYEEHALPEGTLEANRLKVLADVLEEAGCTDAALLAHCRGPGPHVRGCWPLDLLLGRG